MQRLSGELQSLVLTRRSAPAWMRGRLEAGEDARRRRLAELAPLAREALVLHTCERLEVYAVVERPDPEAWEERLAAWLGLDRREVYPHLEARRGPETTLHLLRVACGLESRLVGETQIRGQLLHSWREAGDAGLSGPVTSALVRAALHSGRRVRRETPLGRGRESLVALVLGHLHRQLGTLTGRVVVLAGTGALAAELAPALRAEGASVRAVSRSRERASSFAAAHDVGAADIDELVAGRVRGDALVTCTRGPLELDHQDLARRGTIVLDLGVPHNVPPGPGAGSSLRLTRLEDLETVAPAGSVRSAERIVADEARRFEAWRRERAAIPLVSALLRGRATSGRPSPQERRALHLEIQALKARALA